MKEQWRKVVGYEGRYEVSNLGRIYSTPKTIPVGRNGGVRTQSGKILKQQTHRSGHLRVWLADGSGKKQPKFVHRVVAMAFIENPKSLPVINHIDADPTNNIVSNLEWCTVKENTEKAPRKRVRLVGQANGKTKLDERTVLSIRAAYAECLNAAHVAREFGINERHCHDICKRKIWKHI